MKTKFISFYSNRSGTNYYSTMYERMKSRLDELDATYHIEELESKDNYMLNCLMKPQFILDCIKKFDEPLVWVDIDCTVNQLPDEFDSVETDIAFALREHDNQTPHSALLFFNNTEKSIAFLEEWIKKCKDVEEDAASGNYTGGDHHLLIETTKNNKSNATFTLFPPLTILSVEDGKVGWQNSKINIGLSLDRLFSPKFRTFDRKLQALYPCFSLQHGSSCSKLKPQQFQWTDEEHNIQVFIDNGMLMIPRHPRKENTYRFGWLCESRAIVSELYNALKTGSELFFEHFDAIFTCDDYLLSLDDRFKFALSGSNLPWTTLDSTWFPELHDKTKMCSLLASPKLMTEGHKLRHELASKFKDEIDIFGGVGGSKKVGTSGVASAGHPTKEQALRDYMFSITIENDSYNNYFTEKITDCFANGTIPVYWGCPNIGDYFNKDGIIILDDDFDINGLTKELYDGKIDAMKENYQRISTMIMADDIIWNKIQEYINPYPTPNLLETIRGDK